MLAICEMHTGLTLPSFLKFGQVEFSGTNKKRGNRQFSTFFPLSLYQSIHIRCTWQVER